jgi:hypothetical protein
MDAMEVWNSYIEEKRGLELVCGNVSKDGSSKSSVGNGKGSKMK